MQFKLIKIMKVSIHKYDTFQVKSIDVLLLSSKCSLSFSWLDIESRWFRRIGPFFGNWSAAGNSQFTNVNFWKWNSYFPFFRDIGIDFQFFCFFVQIVSDQLISVLILYEIFEFSFITIHQTFRHFIFLFDVNYISIYRFFSLINIA